MIDKTIRLCDGPKSTQEGVRLLLDFFRLDFLRRNGGQAMRHWTRRLTLQYSKVGQALSASNSEISKDFLHEHIRGILWAVTSGLTSSESESVLATSGTTGAEGESIGNSWKFAHLAEAFSAQWCDAALAARDAKARKSEAVVAAVTILTCPDIQRPRLASKMQFPGVTWINVSMSMKMMMMNPMRKMLTGTLVTVMTSWMKPHAQWVLRQMTRNFLNSLMAIWKTLMRPHLKCMHQQVAVFKKHVSFCLVSRVPEATFPLLALVLMTAWLSHPLIASLQSLVAMERMARGKGNLLRRKLESLQTLVHLASCQNHRPHVPSLVLRCPRSGRLKLAQLVVDHITLLDLVLISMLCLQVGHRASECPNKAKPTAFSPGKRAFGT